MAANPTLEPTMHDRHITLYHAPQTRSHGVLTLLEELAADYALQVLDFGRNEQRGAAYRAINPMGKVPAIRHGDAVVTEQVAIFLYLADLYPEASLAPPIGDALRGPYLRWMAFYGACFEPACMDRALKREAANASSLPYGDFETTLNTVLEPLGKAEYLLGERLCAADFLWGTALGWLVRFGVVPALPVIQGYVERITTRPSAKRAQEIDAELIVVRDAG